MVAPLPPMNPAPTTCPTCSVSLAGGALAGVCPRCAWGDLDELPEERPDVVPLITVPGHEVRAEIARGGGGIVYHALQHEPRREVALKILPPQQLASAEMRARFRGEAETIAALDHPAILPVYSVGEHNGLPFFTMKLASGGTLAARRDTLRGRWRAIATLVAQLADAVQYAHVRGVIHRDLKPGNVLFDDADRAFISDFGLAKFVTVEHGVTQPAAVFGTPAYLAPEVAERGAAQATSAADIYSLGAILYELLAGRPPFAGESLSELLKKIALESPPRPGAIVAGVPRDLDVICLRCLAKEPAKRFSTASALADDLRCWLAGRPIVSRSVLPMERLWQWSRRNPALAVLSVALAGALLFGALALSQSNRSLRAALEKANAAESDAREKLHGSLLAEARLRRQSRVPGQRYETLRVLERAAAISADDDVRSEVAAALARPDLRLEQAIPDLWFAAQNCTIDFSPDLSHYLAARREGGFSLRRSVDGSEVRTFVSGHASPAYYLRFSSDRRSAAVIYLDDTVEVWRLDATAPWWRRGPVAVSRDPLAPNPNDFAYAVANGVTLPDATPQRNLVALHPARAALVYAAADHSIRWVEPDLNEGRAIVPPGAEILGLAFSPDGHRLAVVRRDGCAMWDLKESLQLWSVPGAFSPTEPGWSPDGRRLAVGMVDKHPVLICDAATGRVEQTLLGNGADARFAVFHPDGRQLITVSWDATFSWWDALSGEKLLGTGAWTRTLRFSADGSRVAFSSSQADAGIYELAPAIAFRELRGSHLTNTISCGMDVSPDGRWAATTDYAELRIWDVAVGAEIWSSPAFSPYWAGVRFESDGRSLINWGRFRGLFRRSWSPGSNATPFAVGEEEALSENRDGMLISVTATRGDIWIERPSLGRLVRWPEGDARREELSVETNMEEQPRVSPDGRYIVTSGYPDPLVRVWDAVTSKLVTTLPITRRAAPKFSPDGRWLLTGTDQEYRLWDTEHWQPGPGCPADLAGAQFGEAFFSTSGNLVALRQRGGSCEIRETKNFTHLITLEPPDGRQASPRAWSPDGTKLFLLGYGHRLYVWDLTALRAELRTRGLDW